MSGMEGFILLHRRVMENFVFEQPYLFKLWCYCLMRAAYREHVAHVGSAALMVLPGQFVWGREKAAFDLNRGLRQPERRSAVTWERMLKALEEHEMLRRETNRKFTVITVVNFEYYQRSLFGSRFEAEAAKVGAEKSEAAEAGTMGNEVPKTGEAKCAIPGAAPGAVPGKAPGTSETRRPETCATTAESPAVTVQAPDGVQFQPNESFTDFAVPEELPEAVKKKFLRKNVFNTCATDVQQNRENMFNSCATESLGAEGLNDSAGDFVCNTCSTDEREKSQNVFTNNKKNKYNNKQENPKDLKERRRRKPEITTQAPAREDFSGNFGVGQGQGQGQVQKRVQNQRQVQNQNQAQNLHQVQNQAKAQGSSSLPEHLMPLYPDLLTQYRKAFSQPVTEIITQSINAWANDFGAELVSYALELSGKNQAKSLRYVESILKNWQDEGVQHLADARAQTAAFELMREGARKERLEHQRFAQENQRLPTAELPKVSLHNWLKN